MTTRLRTSRISSVDPCSQRGSIGRELALLIGQAKIDTDFSVCQTRRGNNMTRSTEDSIASTAI